MLQFTAACASDTKTVAIRVYVWSAEEIIEFVRNGRANLNALLPVEENARVNRILSERARLMALAAHAVKRLVLSKLAGISPRDLIFERGTHGKPRLVGARPIYFNLSHCDDGIAFATCDMVDIGVDIESLRRHLDVTATLHFTATPSEMARLQVNPCRYWRQGELIRLWVAKEAVLKSIGIGLSIEPRTFAGPTDDEGQGMHRICLHNGATCAVGLLPLADTLGHKHLRVAIALLLSSGEPNLRWKCTLVPPADLWVTT